jgi:hypothetical protein
MLKAAIKKYYTLILRKKKKLNKQTKEKYIPYNILNKGILNRKVYLL